MKSQSKKSKKSNHQAKSNHNPSPKSLPPIGGAHALPEVGAPTPPAEVAPVVRDKGRHLVKAHRAQLDVALEAAGELRKSSQFALVFGSRYAVAGDTANAIEFAARWSREAQAAKAWAAYTREQSELAWDYTNGLLEKLRAPFNAASGGDSALEKELHAFARLLSVRSDAAKRAAETRAANKKKEQDKKGAAPPTPAVEIPTITNGVSKPVVNGAGTVQEVKSN